MFKSWFFCWTYCVAGVALLSGCNNAAETGITKAQAQQTQHKMKAVQNNSTLSADQKRDAAKEIAETAAFSASGGSSEAQQKIAAVRNNTKLTSDQKRDAAKEIAESSAFKTSP